MIRKFVFTILPFISFLSVVSSLKTIAQNKEKTNPLSVTSSTSIHYSKFNINNISTYIYNTGEADQSNTGDSGFQFPIGSRNTVVYKSGLLWGALVNGKIFSGGSSFLTGLAPGRIMDNGIADDPNSSNVRVYKVRRDYKTASLTKESLDEVKTIQEVFNQYEKDWNEWPANYGAPFEDKNFDGKYNPQIDIPGTNGADQTLWFVANDLDSTNTKKLYGSLPMGIEMHVTIWGYNQSGTSGNVLYKRYKIINKSKNNFKEMYFGIWSDPDLGGDAGDDLVGCDTLLNLGYVFNSDDSDPSYGNIIPAMGFSLLQGPIVNGAVTDKAYFNNKIINGKKNLSMTAFSWLYKYAPPEYGDVVLGNPSGTIELYNYLQGKTRTGNPWSVPLEFGGGYTKFPASGDYIRKTGFYDGVQIPPTDRRMMLCTGPFNMAPGDTQEVVFMELAAGADGVTKNLAAIELLKQSTLTLRNSYYETGQQVFSPTVPNVIITNLDGSVILNWGEDIAQINQIENSNSFYKFEGYNVYQFPKADSKISDGKLIATFDVRNGITEIYSLDFDPSTQTLSQVIKASGRNTGVKRHFQVTQDYIKNKPLINWNEYYFGVSHYSYSFSNIFSNFHESSVNIYKAFPKPVSTTITSQYKIGDVIIADRIAGTTWRWFKGEVIDPYRITNSEYEITFRIENNALLFNIKNLTSGKTIFTNLPEPNTMDEFPIVEGVLPTFAISTTHPLTSQDVFRYKTYALVTDQNFWIDEFDKINVFPNPYYGRTINELFNNDRYVTFTYLPQRAIFRIFNLAGHLVRKFEKDSPERMFKWNLKNDNNITLASGLYIAHIELPDFGKVKILKLAIIQQ
jgi:hypothetical protein